MNIKTHIKNLLEIAIELVVFYFMFILFDIEKIMGISFLRYLFIFLILFLVLRDNFNNNLIWQDAKNLIVFYLIIFVISLVVRPMKYITIEIVLKNLTFILLTYVITLFSKKLIRNVLFHKLASNVVIIGVGHHAQIIADTCKSNKYSLMNVKGFIRLDDSEFEVEQNEVVDGRVISYANLYRFILKKKIDVALIAIPQLSKKDLTKINYDLKGIVNHIKYMPQLNGMYSYSTKIEDYDGQLLVCSNEVKDVFYPIVIKRLIDIIGGLVGCILLIPLTIIIKIANVANGDKGPIFFRQKRIGFNGKEITIYKFRSMVPNAEQILEQMMAKDRKIKKEYLINKKLENDPRITKVGQFIRKTSIDEFPQLINVLLGNMSLVGPRPYLFREIPDMGEFYKTIILTKPGITGMWQVSGRSDVAFDRRCRLDEYYATNQNFWMDFTIMVKTVKMVFTASGAR